MKTAMTADATKERKRLSLVLPERSAQRLSMLVKKTEANGYTDVMKNALRLYEAIVEETEQGNEICIRRQDGQIKSYRFLFSD
ncbi:MAG: ribbon-helix-helix protein, CopG family [Geminicoccaceae bacterium]